jgi:hypothetical protein
MFSWAGRVTFFGGMVNCRGVVLDFDIAQKVRRLRLKCLWESKRGAKIVSRVVTKAELD